jgi:hypothetical protein
MKYMFFMLLGAFILTGCAGSNEYPTHNIGPKTTHVAEEKPDKYPHPKEDLRTVVGKENGSLKNTGYRHGGYYYPSRYCYNRYYWYYH